MNIEEKKEKVAHMHKYFSNSFWLSFILLLIASFVCIAFRNSYLMMIPKYFPQLTAHDWDYLVVLILGIWKILIIQFTLIPALVLWGIKSCCCKHEAKTE